MQSYCVYFWNTAKLNLNYSISKSYLNMTDASWLSFFFISIHLSAVISHRAVALSLHIYLSTVEKDNSLSLHANGVQSEELLLYLSTYILYLFIQRISQRFGASSQYMYVLIRSKPLAEKMVFMVCWSLWTTAQISSSTLRCWPLEGSLIYEISNNIKQIFSSAF